MTKFKFKTIVSNLECIYRLHQHNFDQPGIAENDCGELGFKQ